MADDENEARRRAGEERLAAGAHRAVARLGSGQGRAVTGISLVAVLCASALTPVVAAGLTIGPVTLAGLNLVGAVGVAKLTDVVDAALDALRGKGGDHKAEEESGSGAGPGRGRAGSGNGGGAGAARAGWPSEAELERELTARFELALTGSGESAAQTRAAAAELLRGLGLVQGRVAEGLAGLSGQFTEFAFVAEDIRAGVQAIELSLRQQNAAGERTRDELFRLTKALDIAAAAAASSTAGSSFGPETGQGMWVGCPYLGLMPYGATDAQVFYGRDEMTLRLHQRLLVERSGAGGPLVVTGPSGVGKSSLLKAGLLAALARGSLLPQTRSWPCRVMTPTGRPLRELSAVLAEATDRPARALYETLSLDPARAADVVAAALARQGAADSDGPGGGDRRLVLVVDQFEELFTQVAPDSDGRAEREAFLVALHALAGGTAAEPPRTPARPPALVVAAVRGDFLDQFLAFPELARAYQDGAFVVGPMTAAELRLAITGPAAEAGLEAEPELVDELLREVREHPDAVSVGSGVLPLVSQVMARVWTLREGGRLSLLAYRRVGGLGDAVNRDATEAYEESAEPVRAVARPVFLRLTLVTDEGRVTRRRAPRSELYQAAGGRREEVDRLVESFAARRLLVLEGDGVGIAHEALLQAWDRLQGWLDGDRIDQAVYGRLTLDAESWHAHADDPGYLYPAGRLAEIEGVRARWGADPERYPAASENVTRFLDAGRAAEKARVSRRRRGLASLIALALVATGAAIGAGIAAQRARTDDTRVKAESAVAVSRELAAEALGLATSDPFTARQLAAAAQSVSPTAEAAQAETELLNEQPGTIITPDGQINSVAWSPDGTMLATAGLDGVVRLWNPGTEQQSGAALAVPGNADSASSLAFNRAGTLLAVGYSGGAVRLWNPQTGRQVGGTIEANAGDAPVSSVAFDPAGTLLATGSGDGTLRLWNPSTQKQIGATITVESADDPAGDDGIYSVAFDPSGDVLATAEIDGTVSLWNPSTGQRTRTLELGFEPVGSVAFDPSGTSLAASTLDGTVTLWNYSTGRLLGTLTSAAGDVATWSVAFDRSGTLLAASNLDGTVNLWNPATLRQVGSTFQAGAGAYPVVSVAFDPTGTTLATASANGVVGLWDPATQQRIDDGALAAAPGHGVYAVAFQPVGGILATGSGDGLVTLWNPATRQQIGTAITAAPGGQEVSALAFNPAGTVLATVSVDGSVRLWNPQTQQQIGGTMQVTTALGFPISLVFNPAGTVLATLNQIGDVELWNPDTQQPDASIGTAAVAADGLAFNPAGTVLAAAANDAVGLWDSGSQKLIGTVSTSGSLSTYSLMFNPAGTVLAGGVDGDVYLWNPNTRQRIGSTMTAAPGGDEVTSVVFNPAGTVLASSSNSGVVDLWDPATQQQIGASIQAGPDTDSATDLAFNGSGSELAVADQDGTVTLVDMAEQLDPGPTVCGQFGLPSAAAWSHYVGSGFTEPTRCA
jgi:WD40 repeat protein